MKTAKEEESSKYGGEEGGCGRPRRRRRLANTEVEEVGSFRKGREEEEDVNNTGQVRNDVAVRNDVPVWNYVATTPAEWQNRPLKNLERPLGQFQGT